MKTVRQSSNIAFLVWTPPLQIRCNLCDRPADEGLGIQEQEPGNLSGLLEKGLCSADIGKQGAGRQGWRGGTRRQGWRAGTRRQD